jgi:hypothetical protein
MQLLFMARFALQAEYKIAQQLSCHDELLLLYQLVRLYPQFESAGAPVSGGLFVCIARRVFSRCVSSI